jgi:hypothetical protein
MLSIPVNQVSQSEIDGDELLVVAPTTVAVPRQKNDANEA